MMMDNVQGGEVGVSRSGCRPFVLLQVMDSDPGLTTIPSRAILTVKQAESLIEDLRREVAAVKVNPLGLGGPAFLQAVEYVVRFETDDLPDRFKGVSCP